MKLNTIARTIAAAVLAVAALAMPVGAASADDPDAGFMPPYCAAP
ncbi:hypothetical protein SAMN05216188_12571 [Lentzea xinjiangensis]|uniref:Uncharacterized protein n=1 Tax=Lentzea xinjiangensis TaxID=402600 RepID=A0A1H9VB40_9PSEU|nr:hypothetical protein [Lentzea xinjiangensis]SES18741.1 hypothetical protein SAMN05216188_12571 [Lentzea xinjiangensis]